MGPGAMVQPGWSHLKRVERKEVELEGMYRVWKCHAKVVYSVN